MKLLSELIKNVDIEESIGYIDTYIDSIHFDSRSVSQGSIYVAQKGIQVDGHKFIYDAIEKGANVIVCEEVPAKLDDNITYLMVKSSPVALAYIATSFYDHPSEELVLVGVTGTNGKTSITKMLYNLFRGLGHTVGLLSTIANYINGKEYKATYTTPDAISLNKLLRDMVDDGCKYCFMEVSSHALVQNRVLGLQFKGGVFTNITHDHLDYHKSFRNYLLAKKSFFDNLPKGSFALTNIDDKNGNVMLQNTKADTYSYALKTLAYYKVKICERHFDSTLLEVNNQEVWTKFIGDFNAYNLAAVYGVANLLGVPDKELMVALSLLEPIVGRFEPYTSKQGIVAVVDYAHTPDALENVLKTLRALVNLNNIITVVGAGGNRDKAKRPKMALIACEYSDKILLTSDNPRYENPEAIIDDMFSGVPSHKCKQTLKIVDRREAIKVATMLATPGDVILIAGKGHETYQEIQGQRIHFDDKEEIIKILK